MNPNRLLVVDDEPELCEFVAALGRMTGYDVVTCCHGDEFRRLFSEIDPSIVVIDIVMPEVDGIELVRHLADIGAECSVVAISGYPAYLGMIKSLAASLGLTDVAGVTKPLIGNTLKEILRDHRIAASGVA